MSYRFDYDIVEDETVRYGVAMKKGEYRPHQEDRVSYYFYLHHFKRQRKLLK